MEAILGQEHITLTSRARLKLHHQKEGSDGQIVNQKGLTFSLKLILNKKLDQGLTTLGLIQSIDQSIIPLFQDRLIKQGLLSVLNKPKS
jgi:hypothetical protein